MSNQTQTDWASGVLNKLTNNGERIAVIEFKLDELNKKVDQRFEQVDQRFEQIDQRFDEVDQKFEKIDGRLENIENITQQVESALKWLKWIGGGVAAILLSIIANYFYSFFGRS